MLAGAAVGGGTLVNWMTSITAPDDVRADWARDHGMDGMDGSVFRDDVAAVERELGVRPSTVIPPKDGVILRGAAALGWEAAPITRNERYHQFYAIFFLFQTTIISFTIFHTLI